MAKTTAFVFRKVSDGSEVHRIEVGDKTEKQVELVERGLMRRILERPDLYLDEETEEG